MKNLIKTLILILSTSAIGFSQTPISFSQTKDTVYVNSIFDPYYNSPNDTVNIGDTITIINESGDGMFVSDTNGYYETAVFDGLNGELISTYKINKNSSSIMIGDSAPSYPVNEIATVNFYVLKDTSSAGIGEITYNKINVNIFPNPVKTNFTVKADSKIEKVEILSESGQVVETENFGNSGLTEYEMNVSNIPNGIYFVRINDVSTQKLIINKGTVVE